MSAFALLSALAGFTGCATAEGSPVRLRSGRTNVVVILVDGLGSEQIGPATPELRRLGQQGVRFQQLIANGTGPRPSAGALLTGVHPRQLDLVGRRGALDPHHQTLAEALDAQGYLTLGLSTSGELHSYYGFAQGFDDYQDQPPDDLSGAERLAERSLELVDRHQASSQRDPLFLQVHVGSPAPPWAAPRSEVQAWRERGVEQPRQAAELAVIDQGIGDLIQGLRERDLLEETLLVVVGTHGPEPERLAETSLHVPLILDHPALPAGHKVPQLCDQVDLMPTLLHLLALEQPADLAGESLAALALGAKRDESLSGLVVAETGSTPEDRVALRTHRHKLVRDPVWGLELYRIDQGQELLVEDEQVQRRLAERLRAWEVKNPKP